MDTASSLVDIIPARNINSSTQFIPKVLFDARKIKDGGIGVYIRNTLQGLALNNCKPDLIVGPEIWEEVVCKWSWLLDFKPIFDTAKPYSLAEYLLLARRIDFSKYDLAHFPHYTLPYNIKIPTVITIHDLIHVTHPERFYYPWIAKPLIASSLSRASKIVSVSDASRQEIVQNFSNLEKVRDIRVVKNAINPEWLCSIKNQSPEQNQSYFLSVFSNKKPHKGLKELLAAYKKHSASLPKLILVGQAFNVLDGTASYFESMDLGQQIEIKGQVAEYELKDLYRNAQALIVPSFTEGFCLPLIEAHACGTPAVLRPVPALLENALDEDLVAQDFSVEAWEEVLLKAVGIRKTNSLVDKFRMQAEKEFNLELLGRELLSCYKGL